MKRIISSIALVLAGNFVLAHDVPAAQEPKSLADLTTAFGWNLYKAEITTQKVSDSLYVLFGVATSPSASAKTVC